MITQDKGSGQNEESCSYTSSNRESWGRCSSLGSDDEPSSDCPGVKNDDQRTLTVLATPLRDIRQTTFDFPQDGKDMGKASTTKKKSKREKFEKLEALTQRLCHCILKRVNHKRHCSS